MSQFICSTDYRTIIRSNVEQMVQDGDTSIRVQAEATALDEIQGYLQYDYLVYDILGHRVFDHVQANAYKKGDLAITTDGTNYVALQDVPVDTAISNTAYWLKDELLHPQPHSETTSFDIGETATGPYGERYLVMQNTAGAPLTNTDCFWLKRNNQILMIALELSLYYQHKRIAAKQIPELRLTGYEQSILMLEKIRRKQVNPGLPVRDAVTNPVPSSTGTLSIVSNTKANNAWS
jgi:hypothetical protein